MSMIIEILSHTPRWVFGLFFGLVYLGFVQSKIREVSITRLILLPLAMFMLSLYGVFTAFNSNPLGLACWLIAVCVGVATAMRLSDAKRVIYSSAAQTFTVPGSWLPLSLMMAIFFTKYAVGFSLAQHPELMVQVIFVGIASAAYGIFSGIFLGRMLKIMGAHGKHMIRSTRAA
jgi:hypothetical protein